jgi:translation initiation factor 2 alpha subunit (eIF-2alpha)
MIRLYSNKMPVSGEIVVVKITAFDDHTLIINASLLEYGGINGMICRTETSRNSAKRYKRLSVGKVIPVLCSAVDVKPNGDIFVDLNYVTFDKEQFYYIINDASYNKLFKLIIQKILRDKFNNKFTTKPEKQRNGNKRY